MLRFCILFTLLVSILVQAKEELIPTKLQAYPALASEIKKWLKELDSPNTTRKAQEKIERLGEISLPYLYDYLEKNKNPKTKRRLVLIIEKINSPSSYSVLLSYLTNKRDDIRVREQAALTLAHFSQREEVRKTLAKYAFHRDIRISRACVYSLCKTPDKTSIPILIEILKHWEKSLSHKAQETLTEVTGKKDLSDYEGWKKWWLNYKDIFTLSE